MSGEASEEDEEAPKAMMAPMAADREKMAAERRAVEREYVAEDQKDAGDFDWCLAFGEGSRTTPTDARQSEFEPVHEDEGVLILPRLWNEWPADGYTRAPKGHRLYTETKVRDWTPGDWEHQGEWEALPWSERRAASDKTGSGAENGTTGVPRTGIPASDTIKLLKTDGFFCMMTQYMEKPWECPVHTLKLAFMKSGLDVEER